MTKPLNSVTSATGPPRLGDRLAEALPLRPQPAVTVRKGRATVAASAPSGGGNAYAAPPSGPGGGVTAVGLAMPATFVVANSPVTGSGVLTVTWANAAVNTVFAGPASGGSGPPVFRALAAADLPALGTAGTYGDASHYPAVTLDAYGRVASVSLLSLPGAAVFGASGASHSSGLVPDPGGAAGATRFLREDASWQVPAGGAGASFQTVSSLPVASAVTLGQGYRLSASGLIDGLYVGIQTASGSYKMASLGFTYPLINKGAATLPGTTALWALEDRSGLTAHDTVGTYNLTLSGYGANGTWANDANGNYLGFAAANTQYASGGSGALTGTGDFFVEALCKNDSSQTVYLPMLSQAGATGTRPMIVLYRQNTPSGWTALVTNTADAYANATTSAAAAVNGLTHLVATYASATGVVALYVNGVSQATATLTGTRKTSTSQPWYMGAYFYNGSVTGVISTNNIPIYLESVGTVVPTAAQVLARYNALTQ